MFPGIRLLLVSTLASLVAIACGLGLFATFGVNHGPFARLQNGSPPLQLVFDHTMRMPEAAAAPFGVRFELAASATEGIATPSAVSSGTIAPVSVPAAAPVPVATSEPVAPPVSAQPPAPESTVASVPAPPPSPEPATIPAPAAPDVAVIPSSPETSPEAGHETGNAVQHAALSPTDQAVPDSKTVTDTATPAVAKTPAAAPGSEKAKVVHAAPRHRRVVRRVIRPEAAALQPTAAAQPAYQWVTPTPTTVVQRRRVTKNTALQ